MPNISKEKIKKIEEQIIFYLFSIFPKSSFTSEISSEIARDEEFIKKLLINLNKNGLIIKIDKNSNGIKYERRIRWRLSNKTQQIYSNIK
jgi:predicted transcriptional regulator with HTH domain